MNTQALRTAKPDHPEWDIGRCRYCGLPVVGRRRTFCSDACVHEWRLRAWPSYLRETVFTRDAGICALCGLDTKELPEERVWGYRKARWEADHTIPLVEGGANDMGNVRTLCVPCHRAATAALRVRMAAPKAPEPAPIPQLRLELEET